MYDTPTPQLVPLGTLVAQVAAPIDVGEGTHGRRRIIPILGGTFTGERLSGRVLGGANDYQLIRRDGVLELQARYVIETTTKALIYVENTGMRDGPAALLAAQARGELVDPAKIYFRAVPRFETAAPEFQWLTRRLFVSAGARFPDRVELAFFEIT
jgi:Protein of unknown function (DUF3237)